MKLIQGSIRPGIVLELVEGETGVIKASAPGLFTDADGIDVLPPIYPWPFGYHANSYSCPRVGDEVWIMSYTDNPLQLHWVRKDYLQDALKDLPTDQEEQNLEVVVNREFEDSKWAILYFDNDDGWMMRKGEDGLINIRKDGSIFLKTKYDKRIIDICEDSISLGKEGGAEDNAMLYKPWKEWADELLNQLNNTIATAAASNPYTAPLSPAFKSMAAALKEKIEPVKSNHVTITSN